ncbi:hypothetical protein HKCCE3408_17820 [Rhodobacterales bacterium HKCCE3408]|nr:hypothetical protein [Rhodobacterales bacterium HKCCE3408]
MTAIVLAVTEYWYKPTLRGEGVKNGRVVDKDATRWRRDPSLEISFERKRPVMPDRSGGNRDVVRIRRKPRFDDGS